MNVGPHPRVVEAACAIRPSASHTDFTVLPYENYVGLAERLLAPAPTRETRAAFFNSGAEAIENSIKFARAIS